MRSGTGVASVVGVAAVEGETSGEVDGTRLGVGSMPTLRVNTPIDAAASTTKAPRIRARAMPTIAM
jgi:hypothetical protein